MIRILLATVVLLSSLVLAEDARATHPLPHDPYDHLACYKVNDTLGFRARVQLDAQLAELDIPSSCRLVGRSLAYCSPVRKRVERLRYRNDVGMEPIEMPGHDQQEGRLCYRVKCEDHSVADSLHVEDQFGRHRLREFKLKRLCTNAKVLVDDPPPTTTTTTTLPTDPCALVDCVQGTFCRPSCDDPRAADCVPYQPEGGVCDVFGLPCTAEFCKPSLECVVPPSLPDQFPPIPGICVDTGDGECRVDEDCPRGEVCEPGGPLHPSPRVCVPGCHDDADCSEEQHCQLVDCVTTPCPGFCVPDKCGSCYSDNDCDEGTRCNVNEACLVACDCPLCAVCAGDCIPADAP